MTDVVFQIETPPGAAVCGAAVLAAYPDGRYLTGLTDAQGECRLDLYRTDQEMKVLVASENHLPFHDAVVPGQLKTVPLKLEPSTKGRNRSCSPGAQDTSQGFQGGSTPTLTDMSTVTTSLSTGGWQNLPLISRLGNPFT